MANTFVAIATTTVGSGGAGSVTFSSIPNTYTDLKIVMSARSLQASGRGYASYRYQSISSNYSYRALLMYDANNAATFSSTTDTAGQMMGIPANNATANVFGNAEMYIVNYNSSNIKSSAAESVSENNSTSQIMVLSAGQSADTGAITSITIYCADISNGTNLNQTFAEYSTFTLYGIKNS